MIVAYCADSRSLRSWTDSSGKSMDCGRAENIQVRLFARWRNTRRHMVGISGCTCEPSSSRSIRPVLMGLT